MVVVSVKIADIALGGGVPLELANFILPTQWSVIVTKIQDAHRDGTFWSCCIEITICVLFVFPCIFLCHPCCSLAMTLDNVNRKIVSLNNMLFAGAPVLCELDGNILFNTDLITVTAEAAYLDRTNTAELRSKSSGETDGSLISSARNTRTKGAALDSGDHYVGNPMGGNPSLVSASFRKRLMVITVPDTAGPGSVLTVSAPNGNLLSVVVPHNAEPGASITVQY